MSAQETSIKHSALGWVKKSIDDNLVEIEADLKRYIEDEDNALLEAVKARLQVIQGVLMMIEQYGSAMLTEEMVALADFIGLQKQDQGDQALEVMLRAVLQLPDYLEHIQSGHRDIPIAILPLLNDIRAVRNQDLFSEKLLFLPDLSMHREGADVETIDEKQNQASKLLVKKLRPVYQLALLNVIRDQAVEESLKRLEKVCETLEERSFSEQVARIWWIVGALLESLSRQQLEPGVSIKNLLGKVDALFRVILIIGERGLARRQPIELIKNFLFYIAQPECDGPKTQAIKTAYRLEQFLPSERVRSEVLDNIAGPNQALMKTVAEAMKADIEAVKSTLEVYVNSDLSQVEQLKDLPQEMHVISDTLAMIGLGSQRQLIEAQIETVRRIIGGNLAADEEQLLSMAAELLQVEQALDQMQKRQVVRAQQVKSDSDVSRDYELDNVLMAVVTATLDDIQKTKNAILEFVKDPTHNENIDLCITLMGEARGALELMNQPRAVAVVDGLLTYLKGYDIVEFMETSRLDALSQVVVSLEYYLEALGEHRSDADSILDFADAQLQELLANVKIRSAAEESEALVIVDEDKPSMPPQDAVPASAPVKKPDAPAQPKGDAILAAKSEIESGSVSTKSEPEVDEGLVVTDLSPDSQPASTEHDEMTAEVESAATAASSPPVEPLIKITPVEEVLEVLKAGSDPEILEIYLEEAEEESRNIARLQQDWMLHPEDENAVKNIRRAFHTIKGSGRLVGAMKIGEFAWDYEQLLNRVIDKTLGPDKRIIDAVGQSASALPELVEELKTGQAPTVDVAYLRGLARALAEFRAEQVMIEHARQKGGQESPYDHISNGEQTDWTGIGVGATTQIIPPDRLESAMLEELEPDPEKVDPAALKTATEQSGAGATPIGLEDTQLVSPKRFEDTQAVSPKRVEDLEAVEPAGQVSKSSVIPMPGKDNPVKFSEAVDYASAEEADASQPMIEAVELADVKPLERETIKIETIGEDFVSDDFEEDQEDEILFTDAGSLSPDEPKAEAVDAGAEQTVKPADSVAGLVLDANEVIEEPGIEAPEVPGIEAVKAVEEPGIEAVEAVEELDLEELEVVEELDLEAVEEIEMLAIEAPEEGSTPVVEVAEEIEELTIEAPAESADAETDQEKETPPDPFVEATTSQVPGEEAGVGESSPQELDELTDLSFDPELLIIYQQEVEQHLSTINSVLEQAEQIRELVPNEQIYRALHTILGASRTADIATIGELASLLEKPLKSAIGQNMALDHEIVALYRDGQKAIRAMTSELVATRRLPRIPRDLEISLRALAEDFEEHTVELPEDDAESAGHFIDTLTMMNETPDAEQDNELLTIFVDEANELLEMSDNTLHDWSQQNPDDAGAQEYNAVMELQRYLHTLKGGARMAELKEISDLAHEMESLFIAVIDGRVDRNDDLVELLKDCFDRLHEQVGQAQKGEPMADSSSLVDTLKSMRRGEVGESQDHVGLDDMSLDSEDIDIVSENLPGEPLSTSDRPSQDVIKVRADLLDNLVSSAGEVSIYRARMEQQVAGLGSHLGELGQTIARLKGQLRNLEAETDAQIHYSHRAESSKSGDFDPLEMDRYTMIQELSHSLSESVNDLASLQGMLGEQVKDSETLLLQQSRVNTDLQDGLIKSRMVRFSGLLSRLRRLVRQSSQELGKKADLIITGEQNEVDNKVLDRMVAPLEHIIRNALSHGIETPVERVKKGKPEIGRIAIDITRDGSDVVIRVSDDGAGVNIEKVRNRAIQLGLLDKDRQVSDADLVQYILEPGFSTADHVTQLSGRGVGMDVVDIEIKQLGGTLQIETNPRGTTFFARLPFTLSINQAILVRTGDEIYAIPLINIEGITRLESQALVEFYRQENPEIEYAGQSFGLHHLARLVESTNAYRPAADAEKQPVIFSRSGDVRVALHVDEIIGNREIVVKTLGKQLSQVKGLAGASILADGSVVLILDVNGLIRHSATSAVKVVYHADQARAGHNRDTVMVVDDSITMRRVASKLLERHNFQVFTAKDGVDALAQLEDVQPDVMLLDIEMPRMDGFELATHMQNEENFSRIPIIMITSRTGEKHRDRAFEIGVANYMGKPYQEEELIENIQNALGAR